MPQEKYYKSPLSIFVVWHPDFQNGIKYAEEIYNTFCRDINSPLSRSLGIPVNFRFKSAKGGNTPIDIETSEADRNAIILLIDDELFSDEAWQDYIQNLLDKENKSNARIFPVALTKYAFSLNESRLGKNQFISLEHLLDKDNPDIIDKSFKELKNRLLHDFSRFFYNLEKVSEIQKQRKDPPVKLFVSHAKVDGEQLAFQFRDYINSNTKLKTFFDVNDIADAEDFEQSIKYNLSNSAIVVFLSDQYSSREWCRIEVIVAKRNKSPLVVVNNILKGERRSFPYLGNSPTIRYEENNFDDIIALALFQVLNNIFVEEKLRKEEKLYDLSLKYHTIRLENSPELFNYIDIKRIQKEKKDNKPVLVIYPDPPLGIEELKVLKDFDDSVVFITPTLIHQII